MNRSAFALLLLLGLPLSSSAPSRAAAERRAADADGDGVPDDWDRCPERRGPMDNIGCPDRDGDGDGLVDRIDRCPSVAGVPREQGCPEMGLTGPSAMAPPPGAEPQEPLGGGQQQATTRTKAPVAPEELARLERGRIVFAEPVSFETDTANLTEQGRAAVEAAAKIIAGNGKLRRLRVEGHVDEPGNSAAHAKALSRDRAEVVRKLLIEQGVPARRLYSRGYGYSQLLDKSETPEAQRKNNRIEIIVRN